MWGVQQVKAHQLKLTPLTKLASEIRAKRLSEQYGEPVSQSDLGEYQLLQDKELRKIRRELEQQQQNSR